MGMIRGSYDRTGGNPWPIACETHAILRRLGTPIQIRNVPERVLDALGVKAKGARLSLAAYAPTVLERDARTPAIPEVLGRRRGAPGDAKRLWSRC